MFAYIEDNDLWRRKLPSSKSFAAGFAGKKLEYDFEKNPNIFDQIEAFDAETLIREGEKLLKEEQEKIDEDIRNAFPVQK